MGVSPSRFDTCARCGEPCEADDLVCNRCSETRIRATLPVEGLPPSVEEGSLELIQGEIDSRLEERRIKHPDWRREPTAGSYFKNLPPETPGGHRVPAGKVLDHVHCRGLRVGDALVFPKHANIIVNAGHATARDVLTLAEVMKSRARAATGVVLEEEVMFVGERPGLLPHEELNSK